MLVCESERASVFTRTEAALLKVKFRKLCLTFSASDIIICFFNGDRLRGKCLGFYFTASCRFCPSSVKKHCVFGLIFPIPWFVFQFYIKGQILPALLNNSGARWSLFCLISGCLCLSVGLSMCVCVAFSSTEATCLPCLTSEEIGECMLRGLCLCLCVYSWAS